MGSRSAESSPYSDVFMFSEFRHSSLIALAFLASGVAVFAQDLNSTNPSSLVASSDSTALANEATNDSGILQPWRAAPNLEGTPATPSPVAPESKVLQSWRAAPNLSDNPVEPSPPNPDVDLLGSDAPLVPMTPGDLNAASEQVDQASNNAAPPMETNNQVSVEVTDEKDQNKVSPPLPGDNLTKAPSMNLSTADLLETNHEEARHLWRITPRLFAQTLWDSNVYITKTNPVASMMTSVGLGATLEYGDFRTKNKNFLKLNYFGTYSFYSAASQENALNQMLQAEAQIAWNKLTTRYNSSAIYINGPNRDTGTFVKGTYFMNTLEFIDQYSPKTTLHLTLSQKGNIYQSGLQNNQFYEVRLSPMYQITPKIQLGPEAIAGVNTAVNSPVQRYQIVNGKMNYFLSGKVNVQAGAGFQVNEYASGGQSAFGTSVFDLGAHYTPNAQTSINLLAYRNLNNSASLAAQDYIATGVVLTASRTIFYRWQPNLNVGYENDQYLGNTPSTPSGRVDNYYFLTPSLTYHFLKDERLALRVFYTIRENVSSQEQSYGWLDTQVGLQLNTVF